MTSIDQIRRLLQVVSGAQPSLRPLTRTATPAGKQAPGRDATLMARVAAIAGDDPQRRDKILQAYVEDVLADAFGDELLRDPAFFRLAALVREAMQDDPALAAMIAEVTDQLAEGRAPGR